MSNMDNSGKIQLLENIVQKIEVRAKDLTFEQAMNALEQIVKLLNEGNLPLNETVYLHEIGKKIQKFCQESLDKAEASLAKYDEVDDEEIALEI